MPSARQSPCGLLAQKLSEVWLKRNNNAGVVWEHRTFTVLRVSLLPDLLPLSPLHPHIFAPFESTLMCSLNLQLRDLTVASFNDAHCDWGVGVVVSLRKLQEICFILTQSQADSGWQHKGTLWHHQSLHVRIQPLLTPSSIIYNMYCMWYIVQERTGNYGW